MIKIEIGYDKKKAWTIIAYLTFCIVGSVYFVYLTDTFSDNLILRYIMLPLNGVMLFYVYRLTTKILDKEVVITLTKDSIEFRDDFRPTVLKWVEIKDVKITTDNSDGKSSLILVTNSGTSTVNIAGLDKSPDELNKLITSFR